MDLAPGTQLLFLRPRADLRAAHLPQDGHLHLHQGRGLRLPRQVLAGRRLQGQPRRFLQGVLGNQRLHRVLLISYSYSSSYSYSNPNEDEEEVRVRVRKVVARFVSPHESQFLICCVACGGDRPVCDCRGAVVSSRLNRPAQQAIQRRLATFGARSPIYIHPFADSSTDINTDQGCNRFGHTITFSLGSRRADARPDRRARSGAGVYYPQKWAVSRLHRADATASRWTSWCSSAASRTRTLCLSARG